MDTVDCVVIGAGVIGLAVARALARGGREVVVVEAAAQIGMGTSSRNSEVIHAGIYYPPGSLKAALCVPGNRLLYAYCEKHGVPHKRVGKLIVASDSRQVPLLAEIKARAEANGVGDLEFLDARAAHALEPELNVVRALLSPSTGIVDSHAFMSALQGDVETAGGAIAFNTEMVGGEVLANKRIALQFGGDAPFELEARLVINAGGLTAHLIAASIEGVPADAIPQVGYAKGNYFALDRKAPFTRLIYPVPEPGGLGVHLTLDMAGQVRFGPDVEWIGVPASDFDHELDYRVDPKRSGPFYAAIRSYWPKLPDASLHPDYSGIRVKLDNEVSPDFYIDRICDGALINLFGFESPGLTASLAIADRVAELADSPQ